MLTGEAEYGRHRFVVVANRLPVDRVQEADGSHSWQGSPGGLVSALEPVMRAADGAWVGWSGMPGEAPEPFHEMEMDLVPVALSEKEVERFYEGFSNATVWPLYHDVIAPPEFHRSWWESYQAVNERFAATAAGQAAEGATVWVHDYQLQLVPALLRRRRPDLRIGFFNHIPFPGYEIFAQLPWRRQIIEGLLGADLLGFQRRADVTNFMRACRRAAGRRTASGQVHVTAVEEPAGRVARAASYPISIDAAGLAELAATSGVIERSQEIRDELGNPRTILLGIDRLDYTKGILHRLHAYEELLADGLVTPADAVLIQVATPSRDRVQQYRKLREDVEGVVGRINGEYGTLGRPAVHYLHHTYPRPELAALYRAADVMVVTPLRDGMNLVAKEYVACRHDEGGALVLSEFTGAADELGQALLVNPHDVDQVKQALVRAIHQPPHEARRRMRSLRRQVRTHDVGHWASSFLAALEATDSAD